MSKSAENEYAEKWSGSHVWNKTETKHCRRTCSRETKQYFILFQYYFMLCEPLPTQFTLTHKTVLSCLCRRCQLGINGVFFTSYVSTNMPVRSRQRWRNAATCMQKSYGNTSWSRHQCTVWKSNHSDTLTHCFHRQVPEAREISHRAHGVKGDGLRASAGFRGRAGGPRLFTNEGPPTKPFRYYFLLTIDAYESTT